MADTPDTPKIDTPTKAAPRRAPRATTAKPGPKPSTAKTVVAKVTAAAKAAPEVALDSVKHAADVAHKSVTPKTPKPRSTKRATPHTTGSKATKRSKRDAKTAAKTRGGWGLTAAAIGGVAAVGAAAAALLTLRGSTPKLPAKGKPGEGAHQADGKDASKSFEAGIADEGTIPN